MIRLIESSATSEGVFDQVQADPHECDCNDERHERIFFEDRCS